MKPSRAYWLGLSDGRFYTFDPNSRHEAKGEEIMEKHADMLRRFLGAHGCQSAMLEYDALMDTAKLAFDVPGTTMAEVAINVDHLGRRVRSARVREAIRKYWPTPNPLWPARAPVRRALRER